MPPSTFCGWSNQDFFELLCEVVSLILNCIVQDVIEKGEKQPNLTIGILVSIVVVFMTIIFRVLFGGKKPKPTVVSFQL